MSIPGCPNFLETISSCFIEILRNCQSVFNEIMQSILSVLEHKETMVDLSRQLKEALNKESLLQTSKDVQSKVTVEQLQMMTEHFR